MSYCSGFLPLCAHDTMPPLSFIARKSFRARLISLAYMIGRAAATLIPHLLRASSHKTSFSPFFENASFYCRYQCRRPGMFLSRYASTSPYMAHCKKPLIFEFRLRLLLGACYILLRKTLRESGPIFITSALPRHATSSLPSSLSVAKASAAVAQKLPPR